MPSASWPRNPRTRRCGSSSRWCSSTPAGRPKRRRSCSSSSQDYPELAEPHNNLAAIYAAAGDYGKSRAELEETIRLNPSYAPAHENLGDVHALLAAQSYARALRLEPTSATLPRKLALVRQLTAISSEPKAAPPQPAARPASAVRR